MKILIVEDDPINLKLINVILSSSGYKIFDSEKAGTAIEKIKNEKPDLILLDLVLPDMSGTDLATKLKKDESTSKIPIIAITGFPDRFGHKELVHSGFDAYLVKPINTRVLLNMVEGLLPPQKIDDVNIDA
jgi:DNA-binding response OmpR family regulator